MLNRNQIVGLAILSAGVLLVIYSLQEGFRIPCLISGIAISLAGIGLVLWANR